MDTQTIHMLIQQGLPDAVIQVQGDDGVHFEALIVSPAFAGKLPLARHRMVYATLGERMGGEIHALALRTLTPEEHARQQATQQQAR
ncbi:BolA/IbaG family iron-sulfur metabolism protein [Luteimonas sp. BDR2-5]|uniref:BolA family protein n=1 Tax=Proluteimonas luteida TaxID=2878685 RepID=UPI001E42D26D|nr:BolA/IbaG family iron-sulfur metabolism protein [Luteimonas sp. BDR2-5]MCD9029267.1 BolA/IbaG family iron-sulfur metabolism protein [Luteimonas sp. BDR2-5]